MNGTAVRASLQSIKDAPFDFTAAAEAVRFAIEELPAPLLNGTFLEVEDQRFEGDGIRALYEREDYPLSRAARSPEDEPET